MNRWDRAIDLREQVRELTEWKNNGIIDISGDNGIQVTLEEMETMPKDAPLEIEYRGDHEYPVSLVNIFHGERFFCLLTAEQNKILQEEGVRGLWQPAERGD